MEGGDMQPFTSVEQLPTRIPVLPYRSRVLLPGAVLRLVCASPSSLRLVETHLWQDVSINHHNRYGSSSSSSSSNSIGGSSGGGGNSSNTSTSSSSGSILKHSLIIGLVPAIEVQPKDSPTLSFSALSPRSAARAKAFALQGAGGFGATGTPGGSGFQAQLQKQQQQVEGTGGRAQEDERGVSVGLQQWLGSVEARLEPVDFQGSVGGLLQGDLLQWHKRGVAARVLHVGKGVQGRPSSSSSRVSYTLVVEGLVRFEIEGLHTRGPFHTADVVYRPNAEALLLPPPPPPLQEAMPGQRAQPGSPHEQGVGAEELAHLEQQLSTAVQQLGHALSKKHNTQGLLRLLNRSSTARQGDHIDREASHISPRGGGRGSLSIRTPAGSTTAAATAGAQAAEAAARLAHAADVVVACVEPDFAARLAMLDALDLRSRLGTAVDVLHARLVRMGVRRADAAPFEAPAAHSTSPTSKTHARGDDGLGSQATEPAGDAKSPFITLPSIAALRHHDRGSRGRREGVTDGISRGSRGGEDTAGNGRRGVGVVEDDDDEDEVAVLERRMEAAALPANVWRHVRREIRRLRKMQPQQPGYSTSLQYLELLADLPWNKSSNLASASAAKQPHGRSSGGLASSQRLGVGQKGACRGWDAGTGGGVGGRGRLERAESGSTVGEEEEEEESRAVLHPPHPETLSLGAVDVAAAKEQLDREHFGLEKVKQRIVEYIAVRKLKPDATGPVLCFVGPPGVGKTSLASSIASALGRKFVRIALGGVKDEADIRGHRRTYVGSMPGRLIEGVKRVGVNNPVMLLDELDKTGADARGDPAAALLEVLDPEQNKCFTDHYVGLPFDLSRTIFLATANRTAPIPAPLLDRMEVIEIPGYTPEEKLRIAVTHLIPRILHQHGLTKRHLVIPEHMVDMVIQRYTREAGVRNLSRHLAALARAAAVQVAQSRRFSNITRELAGPAPFAVEGEAEGDGTVVVEMDVDAIGLDPCDIAEAMVEAEPIVVDEGMVEAVLGPPKFDGKEAAERVSTPGVAVGLVWTAVGGEVQFVEATLMAGRGELHLTGQLGDVIKESAQIALTWVRSRAADLLSGACTPKSSPPSSPRQTHSYETGAIPAAVAAPAPSSAGGEAGVGSAALVAVGDAAKAFGSSNNARSSSGSRSLLRKLANVSTAATAASAAAAANDDLMRQHDVHIHFPAGAVPKDGPSAGVTLATALVSLLTQRCVRADTAMTGEITLTGLTLPVGGIKEKILAAHRSGIRRVILPQKNIKDLQEVPAATLACMEILPTSRIEEVLQEAFEGGIPSLLQQQPGRSRL